MAVRNVLNGRYAECSLGGVLVALLYEWDVKFKGKQADLTAHGDKWRYIVPLPSEWTFRAKAFVVPASANHLLHTLWSASTLPAYFTVTGYSGTVASGTPIFSGSGLPSEGTLAAPMELSTQEFVIEGQGAPTVGVSA